MRADRFERAILELLAERRTGASICPSEAARRIEGDDKDRWRAVMGSVRAAARRLAAEGRVEITQRGEVVNPEDVLGAIRIRLA